MVQDDFDDLLSRQAKEGRDGGRLLSAAWQWPEEREYVFEGLVVTDAIAAFEFHDLDAAIARLGRERV